MPSSWTNLSPPESAPEGDGWAGPAWELLVPAAAAPARSRGQSLVTALRTAIRDGRLAAGTRLPSSRDLADDLRVSRGLVTEVYARLVAESYLVSRLGAGTWVAALPTRLSDSHEPDTGRSKPRGVASPASSVTDSAIGSSTSPDAARIDFRPGVPALALFPRAAWSAAYQRAIAAMPHEAFDYPDPRGLPELRTALAELLARRRGVAVDPDGLLVCSGVSQALTLIARVAAARGHRTVAVEDPGSPSEVSLLEAGDLTARPVPLDAEGVDMEALSNTGSRLFVATPSHQFPTGVAYSPARRAALLGWARENRALIVEDDYDGEFRYDRAPVGALQGLAPDRVAYAGSVSKSLAPGLRLGWLVPPAELLADLIEAKRVADLGNPAPDQAALAEFLRSGRYDQHLRRCQRAYRERRDALRDALAAEFPDVRTLGIAAGLHLIAEFPARYGPARDLVARAAAGGVLIRPLGDYAIGPGPEPSSRAPIQVVLGYAGLTPRRITAGVEALARVL